MKILKQYKLFVFAIVFFLICVLYDVFKGQNDGIIRNVYFYRVFFRVFVLIIGGYILSYFTKSKFSVIKVIAFNTIFTIVFLCVFEFIAFIYGSFFYKDAVFKPSHILVYENPDFKPLDSKKQKHYGDLSDLFGRWRVPNSTLEVERCGDKKKITYVSNSVGARDEEREKTGKGRIVWLGDSYSEGNLINQPERLSTMLEAHTKIKHLNFAIIEANPLVYYSIYKDIVKSNYEHDALIVGIFLGNDFESSKKTISGKFLNFPNYRPFWNKNKPSDTPELKYTLAKSTHSFESHYIVNHPEKLRTTRDSLFATLPFYRKIWVDLETNSYLLNFVYSKGYELAVKNYFKNYQSMYEKPPLGTDQALDFEYSFHKLIAEAKGKKVVFVLIPDQYDVVQYKISKINNLKPKLDSLYGPMGVKIIDLLPAFAKYPGDPHVLHIDCDGHWNEKGNAYAMQTILKDPIYIDLLKSISLK
jgi:hypothetical protein